MLEELDNVIHKQLGKSFFGNYCSLVVDEEVCWAG
jgi:hypothetical protein